MNVEKKYDTIKYTIKSIESEFVMEIKELIASYQDDMIAWRRDFHAHPETGFEEVRTSAKIVEILESMDLEIVKDFCEKAKTAVIAIIRGKEAGPVIGLRADIDALPLSDSKSVSYASQYDGKCHACGHDVHTTVALGIARYYSTNKDKLKGTLKIVFQPAEEGPAPGGATLIVDTKKLDDVDYMIGAHTNPDHPVGKILLRRKEMMASADNFSITIHGTGGHGAYPHQTIDPLRTGIEVYNALQNMLTREVDPVKATVLSICSFNAGTLKGTNVIPSSITMSGTVRSFDNDNRDFIIKRMEELIKSICEMNKCTCEFNCQRVSIAFSNEDFLVDIFEQAAVETVGKENVSYMQNPEMGYDDFAYYAKVAKVAFFYFGTTNPQELGKYTFHQPAYDVDESCMPICVELIINMINNISKLEG